MPYDFQKRSDDAGISFDRKNSLTKQEFVSQCNINNIVNKYVKNGNNPFILTKDAKFGDFTNIPSHQEALELVIAAEEHFLQLPVHIRSRFENDPGQLMSFLSDIDNREEAIKLGLVQDLNSNLEKKSPAKPDVKAPEEQQKA
jgi:phage internal scaffolding protein